MKYLEKYKLCTQKYYGLFYRLNSFVPDYFENWHGMALKSCQGLKYFRTNRVQIEKHNFNHTGSITLTSSLETIVDDFSPYFSSVNQIAICEYEVDDNNSVNFSSFKVTIFDQGVSRWDIIKVIKGNPI
ncbi:hypothetical protein FDH01_gp199 [Acinetobacter phage vB_AbaM_ME3]|uniref:Uncharacterized protein n=1 Tax=Acinetobacter phage vB_AbaM_ME3 TaxID=1837876 RepID=A0A172Q0V6_9CAUD|nr:hypothetical protein FDH01_gp199 [Acinetobacter phage vB_AbaM_ME3]AND75423.1 hypothetical protein ME3_262 [Acinetobacter phage vB_AbaM_ME3]